MFRHVYGAVCRLDGFGERPEPLHGSQLHRIRLLPSNPSAWTGQLSMKTLRARLNLLSYRLTDECLASGHLDTSQRTTAEGVCGLMRFRNQADIPRQNVYMHISR